MTSGAVSRRDELLELAATMFADRGLRATTVRDIADAAGILSGSLYHHFCVQGGDGRRGVAGFLGWLFERYREVIDTEPNPMERLQGLFMARSTPSNTVTRRWSSIRTRQTIVRPAAVLLPQRSATSNSENVGRRPQRGHRAGYFVPISTSIWCTGSFVTPPGFRCAGINPADPMTAEQVGRQYLPSCSAESPPELKETETWPPSNQAP